MIFSGTKRLIIWKDIKYNLSCFPYMALEVIQEKTWHQIFVWILTLSWNSGIALLKMVVLHPKTVESSGSPFMVPGRSCWYYWAPIKVPRYSWHKRRRVSEVLPFKLRSGLEYQNSTQNTSSKMPWVSIAHCAIHLALFVERIEITGPNCLGFPPIPESFHFQLFVSHGSHFPGRPLCAWQAASNGEDLSDDRIWDPASHSTRHSSVLWLFILAYEIDLLSNNIFQ